MLKHFPSGIHTMRSLEKLIESLIPASRWLFVVFYFSHAAALAIYAFSFALKLGGFFTSVMALALAERDNLAVVIGHFLAGASALVLAFVSSAQYAAAKTFIHVLFGF
jgi:uncharacterized membrane protein YqhA